MKFKLRWLWASYYQPEVPQWTRDLYNWGPRKKLRDIRWDIQRFFGDYFYRLPFKGYKARDLWSIDYAMFKWVLPRLKAFKKHLSGLPGWCFSDEHYEHLNSEECKALEKEHGKCTICKYDWEMAEKKWVGIIDDMIFALQSYVDGIWDGPVSNGHTIGYWYEDKGQWISGTPEDIRAERGYKYFIEHIFSLWD